jgi:signal transduction histidine kinase
MTNPFNQTGLYQKRRMWTLIGMLMLVVIIPTVCLLWFVSEAVRNERMAVRQKLTEVYQSQLESLPPMLQTFWEQKINKLSAIDPSMSPSERFNKIIGSGLSDSVILYDSSGELIYPCEVESPHIDFTDFNDEWDRAESLEFRKIDDLAAAKLYADIAVKTKDINLKARALQRQVRCLGKAGKKDDAVNIVANVLSKPKYNEARDNNGRLIVTDGQLFVLQSMKESSPVFESALENLVSRVKDYSSPVMPSSQRLFLMKALKEIDNDIEFSTFDAEKLALTYRQLETPQTMAYGLSRVPENDFCKIVSPDQTIVALFEDDRVVRETQTFINSNVLHAGARFVFIKKDLKIDSKPLLRTTAGDYLPDWEIVVNIEDDDLFMAASERQISVYIWTAFLIIVGILILTVITARLFIRQMSLSRMKNDLITTVSHELKTPLASIRVLVDTLIDGKYQDENLVKSYIDLIAKENERLTRLIENFLTFSRIEDKRQTFDFQMVAPEKIVQSVYDNMKHRFESNGFSFELTIAEGMPNIIADRDALVMALMNLLDNAYHYSDKVKSVAIAVYAENGNICFDVKDKGIGLSPETKKKILKPFYQVDQTLSRRGGGFGLGLSIVKSIVDAHHGSMEIKSEQGKGSIFTIKVPEMK